MAVFCATLAWLKRGPSAAVPLAVQATQPLVAEAPAPSAAVEQEAAVPDANPKPPLPAEHLAALIEAGINADDSEQRSLAIIELSLAPVEQSLPALARILMESRDSRSRLTALEQLLRLPDSPLVRENRLRLLAQLVRDPDHFVAAAARAATG